LASEPNGLTPNWTKTFQINAMLTGIPLRVRHPAGVGWFKAIVASNGISAKESL
jgi:hypothetical protein